MDLYSVSSDYAGINNDESFQRTETRRVRLGAEGKMNSKFRYRAEFELNRGAIVWQDLFLEYVGKKGSLVLGNQKTIAVLDEVSSDPVNLFNERAAYANAFGLGDRRLGLSWKMAGPRWTFDVGAFGDSVNNSNTPSRAPASGAATNGDEGYAVGGRVTYAPIFEITPAGANGLAGANVLHLGAGVRYRDQRDDALLSYNARPAGSNFANQAVSQGLANTTITTATNSGIATTAAQRNAAGFQEDTTLWGELAYIHGPFGVHVEYATVDAKQAFTGRDYNFAGGFVDAFYQLTGETRQLRQGEFRRMVPARPVDQGGPGLWQVGARYDVLDLTDGNCAIRNAAGATATNSVVGSATGTAVCGGTQSTVGAVVNWQPVEFVKFTAQYASSAVRGGQFNSLTPITGRRDGTSNVVQFRAQFDF
jgi:phosphate-selective porin OprO/OprP